MSRGCTAVVCPSEPFEPIILVNGRIRVGERTRHWWCDVARSHPTKAEAIACNRRTVVENPLHATHGHKVPS